MVGRSRDFDWPQVVYKYGVPSAIALALTWFLMHSVTNAQAKTQESLERHITDMQKEQIENRFYLRAICVNGAHDDAQRASCVPPEFAR